MIQSLFQHLIEKKMIAIIRGITEDKADLTVESLYNGGIGLIEVTMNTDGALNMLSRWKDKYANTNLLLGAGTVLDLKMAKAAISAGAQFMISPNLDESVIAYGIEHQVAVWPGVMTPTEIVRAYNAGASAVKVFPTGVLGASFIKEVRAPLSHIPMIATGGVTLENIGDFFKAGAVAVGLGSSLVDKKLIDENRFDELTLLAQKFVKAASEAKRRTNIL